MSETAGQILIELSPQEIHSIVVARGSLMPSAGTRRSTGSKAAPETHE
jgi:hypothetical protein